MRFNVFMETYSVCGWQCFLFLFKRNLNDVSLLDEINSVRKEIVNSL